MIKLHKSITALACLLLMSLSATTTFAQDKLSPDDAGAKQAYALGVQAYIWGYPMVVMQKSRDAMTKGGESPVTADQFNKSGLLFAPVNQIANAWGMLGPKFSAVQSGNSDTQYSVTWFDSSVEPYVLHIPKSNGSREKSLSHGILALLPRKHSLLLRRAYGPI